MNGIVVHYINKLSYKFIMAAFWCLASLVLNELATAQQTELGFFKEKDQKNKSVNKDGVILYGTERPKRNIPGLRKRQYDKYIKSNELLNMEPPQEDAALELLLDQNFASHFNEYERAVFYNVIASIYQSQEKYQQALKYFNLVLAEGENIPYDLEDGVNFIIGQLYFALEDYEASLPYLNNWLIQQADPPARNLIFIANAYYYSAEVERLDIEKSVKYKRTAIDFINGAIISEENNGRPAKENWYVFLRMLHNNLEDNDRVLEIAELLVSRWPKKQYWTQLSGLYARKAGEEESSPEQIELFEEKQMVTMEIAHRQGMLDKARELETMSQLFLYHDIPYKSSKTLANSMNAGISEKTYKNYDMLSMAYIKGKDIEKSIEPLSKAAELSVDGELYMRLANIYLQLDKFAEGAEAIDKGIAKGGVKRPDIARFMQGQAYVYIEKFDLARAAFREASKDQRIERNANTWLKYVDGEEKRIKDIKEFLN